MKGIDLSFYREHLYPLEGVNDDNYLTFLKNAQEKIKAYELWLRQRFGERKVTLIQKIRELPIQALKRFSFHELCLLKFFSVKMMHESVGDLFKDHPGYELVRKLESSMERWGYQTDWNTLVEAYYGICKFNLGVEDFEVNLDYSTYHNERGYSKYSRTFLDGVFAFLVHYQGKHVMTIGFTVVAPKKIYLSQVQMVNSKGNRFLYKLPENRFEWLLDLFFRFFPGFEIYLVNGKRFADNMLREKRMGFEQRMEDKEKSRSDILLNFAKADKQTRKYLVSSYKREIEICKKVKALLQEYEDFGYAHMCRLYSAPLGKYIRVCQPEKCNNQLFHRILRR